jgi:glycosyltransferase involved in cell wall biosynthesis
VNIIIVNFAHPDTPHVSGVRAWQFAVHLAKAGHRVVVGTSPSPEAFHRPRQSCGDDSMNPSIHEADFRRPSRRIPAALRKARTALQFAIGLGPEERWARALEHSFRRMEPAFPADVVMGVFGNIGAAHAARRIARHFDCPWVMDVKDSFDLYIPYGLRTLSAMRLRSAAATTCNSDFQRRLVGKWLGKEAQVVYSGVDEAFYARNRPVAATTINIIGGIYSPLHLVTLLRGIDAWARSLSADVRARYRVRYLGADGERFAKAVASGDYLIPMENEGYVPVKSMAEASCGALINAYIWHPGGFHHKLLELLAAGRPVLAVPGETEESKRLARECGSELHVAGDEQSVARAISRVFDQPRLEPGNAVGATNYTWDAQVVKLESLLRRVVARPAVKR